MIKFVRIREIRAFIRESAVNIPSEAGDDDDVDRRDAECPDGEGTDDGNPDGELIQLRPLSQTECRNGYQRHHRRTYASEDGGHHFVILKLFEEDGDGEDDEERRQGCADGCGDGSAYLI